MTEAERIARGLTEAQREAVISRSPHQKTMGGWGRDCGCPGLIQAEGINHPIFGAHYRLTPLGLAVRALLTNGADDGK